jgi:redox-sensitive bicupin YhaK (pirin superfamily)
VSNTELHPVELDVVGDLPLVLDPGRPAVEVLTAREVPLGGLRSMTVRRTLPQRHRSFIGAWCFADHYGPNDVTDGSASAPPHPHAGLQTVTWLFAGELEHFDSMGTRALVRPGELNVMTSGQGICHAELPTPSAKTLHGVQLWVALPDGARHTDRGFRHFVPTAVDVGGGSARVFIGTLAGDTSPVDTFTPLLGAEILLAPKAQVVLAVDETFEHGVLLDTGSVAVAGSVLKPSELGYVQAGVSNLELTNVADSPARMLLLGGTPFGEEIVMWWNFVARSHEEIVAFREAWQSESDQFGRIDAYAGKPRRLLAPAIPNVLLKPRGNPAR